MFTNKEWPKFLPQRRENFSIGPEQSISTVAALSWSSPGLAKYRRCLLAVLTSNLILSLYESVGLQEKWIRVAVVGHALQSHFSKSINNVGLRLRKSRIRSFAWCPPIKYRVSEDGNSPDPVSRWGLHILVVANDDNDLIFLLVRRRRDNQYTIDVLSVMSVHEPLDASGNYPMIMKGSLFAAAVRSRFLLSHISCGPWISQSPPSADTLHSFVAMLGIIHGTKLKTIELNASIPVGLEEVDSTSKVNVNAVESALPVSDCNLELVHFTGPLQWIFEVRPGGRIGTDV
jgi:transcription initiation factor TFIIIC delta subunit-like protein